MFSQKETAELYAVHDNLTRIHADITEITGSSEGKPGAFSFGADRSGRILLHRKNIGSFHRIAQLISMYMALYDGLAEYNQQSINAHIPNAQRRPRLGAPRHTGDGINRANFLSLNLTSVMNTHYKAVDASP